MTRSLSTQRLTVATLVVITAMSATIGLLGSSAAETNTLRVQAGETLEIGTDTASPSSDFSWILTKDRKFQSAQRSRFFQTRLAEPGTYVLDVSVQDAVTSESGYRAFTIIVTEPGGSFVPPIGNRSKPLAAVLQTDPPIVNGSAYVPPEGGMLKIDPSASDGNIASYHIDLNVSLDSDGDGDPTNDIDNLGTLSEKSGTPLYVFMLPGNSERRIRLSVADLNTVEPKTAELPVQFAQAPIVSSQSIASPNPNSPVILRYDGPTVHFSAQLPEALIAGREVVYEWDFGDQAKSLLYSPAHTYSAAGTYSFSLRIKDISNAEVLYEGTDSLTIDTIPDSGLSSSSDSAMSSSAASSSVSSNGESKSSMKGVLTVSLIILLLLAFAVGLYALFTWIKRKTTTGLQKTLEKMEGSLVNKSASEEQKPAPMKLKKEVPKTEETKTEPNVIVEREKSKKEFKPQGSANETAPSGAGPVPSWLAKAATTPAPVTQPKPTPTPAPAPTPKPAVPSAPVQAGPTPAWLKPAAQPVTPAPAAAVPPKPAPAPVAPKPAPVSAAPEVPKPQPKPIPVPPPVAAPTPKPTMPVQPPVPAPVITPEAPKPLPKPEIKPEPAPVAATPKPIATVTAVPTAPAVTKPLPETKTQETPMSAPVQSPQSKPVSQPILPLTPKPQPEEKVDEDQPIAIIQADSISK